MLTYNERELTHVGVQRYLNHAGYNAYVTLIT